MPRTKSQTIYDWKRYGLIYDDYDELYEVYIKTMNCGHCNKEFTKSNHRCMDHDHKTGKFRNIVCKSCNVCDSYIKYPNGYTDDDLKKKQQEYRDTHKEQSREYNKNYKENNKDKVKGLNRIWDKKKTTCLCGSVISNGNKSDHLKTQKHLNNMDKYMENID